MLWGVSKHAKLTVSIRKPMLNWMQKGCIGANHLVQLRGSRTQAGKGGGCKGLCWGQLGRDGSHQAFQTGAREQSPGGEGQERKWPRSELSWAQTLVWVLSLCGELCGPSGPGLGQ